VCYLGTDPAKYRRHELHVSTYQQLCILALNNKDTFTLVQIRQQTIFPTRAAASFDPHSCTRRIALYARAARVVGHVDDDTLPLITTMPSKLKRSNPFGEGDVHDQE
jgi:hypothetical protein